MTDLIEGRTSREEVSRWAAREYMLDRVDVDEDEALNMLTLIDARHNGERGRPGDYMYYVEDLVSLRNRLLAGPVA